MSSGEADMRSQTSWEEIMPKKTEREKTIVNACDSGDACVLAIDGKYFGYDNDPAYPETLYDNLIDAHLFSRQTSALDITTWHSGTNFKLVPVK